MYQASDWLEQQYLNISLRGAAWSQLSATTYVGIHHADIDTVTDAGNAQEQGSGAYRQGVQFNAPAVSGSGTTAGYACTSSNLVQWTVQSTSCTIYCVSIWTSQTVGQGNCLYVGPLDTAKAVVQNDTFQMAAGDITVKVT